MTSLSLLVGMTVAGNDAAQDSLFIIFIMGSAHCPIEMNIRPMFNENPSRSIKNNKEWIMGSTHHFFEINILPKFHENPSKAKRDMKGTRNSRLFNYLSFDLHLESE